MDAIDGDDRVMATAHHIIRTLGSDNANDMLRILSTFDDRFSRFNVSLPRNGSEDAAIPTSAASYVQIEGAALQKALDLIHDWDFGASESARLTFIWTDDADVAGSYLDAIDSIQSFIENPPADVDPSVMDRAQNALHLAMLRLEEEFRNLMEKYGETIDPDALQEMTFKSGESDKTDIGNEIPDSSECEPDDKSLNSVNIDLFPREIVSALFDIATRMVNFGYQTECSQVFVFSRKAVLEEHLQTLGLERLTIEDVQRMPWNVLENEIHKWIRIMKITVGVLFQREKELCVNVLNKEMLVDGAFYEIAKGSMTQLLNFGEAVAIGKRASEKLFKILDMYEALRDLLPSINGLFVGECSAILRNEAGTVLERLGDAARGTFAEFENAVQHNTSRNPLPGGTVHPLTRYVMNYIRFFSDYTEILNQLLKDRNELQAASFNNRSEAASSGPLSMVTLSLLDTLENSVDAKSKLYRDPALALLFLMNNLHYIVQKSKDVELRKLVGDDWIRRHSGKLHQYHTDYRRTAWTKVLSFLRDDGINVSSRSISSATKNLIKERFSSFNTAFEEIVKTQSSWIVSDSQLCAELQISITGMILPAYRNFLGRFQSHLDGMKNRERYVKYTPEDVEDQINTLFEGGWGSLNRRRGQGIAV